MSNEQKEDKPQAGETKALSPIQTFEKQLTSYRQNLSALLAAHNMSENEFMVTALNAVKKTPALLNADRSTLVAAILTSAELGLPPNTPMSLAFILPYNRSVKKAGGGYEKVLEAQFQIGYQGWLEIMQRNPKVESIDSGIVYEKEKWQYNKGLRVPFSHEPLPPKDRGVPIGAYAIAWIKGSEKPKVVFLYKDEIMEFKKISQGAASDFSPWNSDEKDPQKWMWRKTCLKQLAKELPKTRDMSRAYIQDNAVEMGGTQRLTEDGTVEVVETTINKHDEKNQNINESLGNQVTK